MPLLKWYYGTQPEDFLVFLSIPLLIPYFLNFNDEEWQHLFLQL